MLGCQSTIKKIDNREPASLDRSMPVLEAWSCSLADDQVYFQTMLNDMNFCLKAVGKNQDPYQACVNGYHAATSAEMNFLNYKIVQKVNGLAELNDIEYKLNKNLKTHKVVNGAIPDAGEGTFASVDNYFDSSKSEVSLDVPEFRALLAQISTELVRIIKKNKSVKTVDQIIQETENTIGSIIAKYDIREVKIDKPQARFLAIVRDRTSKNGPRPDQNYEYTLQSEYGTALINLKGKPSRILDFYYLCKN